MNSGLLEILDYRTAKRENRLGGAEWVLAHPETIEELLGYCFDHGTKLSYKATWVLEFVCLKDLELLYPHLDYFFSEIGNAYQDQSVRPLSHICEMLALNYYKKQDRAIRQVLTEDHKKMLLETCFDWLITDQKVACQVRAMTCLYYLGTEIDWIHAELKRILTDNIHKGSAGYCSRGKKVLNMIDKFRS